MIIRISFPHRLTRLQQPRFPVPSASMGPTSACVSFNRLLRRPHACVSTPPPLPLTQLTPLQYGKDLDCKQETYTTHDVASVFRRYLTQMPEPVIPYDLYHEFRDALAKQPNTHEQVVTTYKRLLRQMPPPNQYLLLYVLDLLSVFARKSDKNLMTAESACEFLLPRTCRGQGGTAINGHLMVV